MAIPNDTCSECCTCPTAVVEWDSRSASGSKVGYPTNPASTGVYDTNNYANYKAYLTATSSCGNPVYYPAFPTDFPCPNSTYFGNYDFQNATQFSGPGGGYTLWTVSDEYTTATLKADTVAALPAYDNDWNDTAGSFANLTTDELTYSIRESRYRLRFKPTKIGFGTCYKANWVTRFIAEAGVGIDSVEVISAGVYRPTVTFSAPPAGGTQSAAFAVMNATGGVTGFSIANPGSGYITAPTVTVATAINSGTTSTGWVAALDPDTGQVTTITGGSAGNYLPTLTFSAPGGSPAGVTALATTTMDAHGGIAAVVVGTAGTKYTAAPTLTVSPKVSGSTAAVLHMHLGSETAKSWQWSAGDSLANGRWFTREVAPAGHSLTSIEVVHGGTGFTSTPTIAISGGGGTGATATATVSGGAITGITIVNAGTGYKTNPTITLSYGGAANVLLAAHFGTETEYTGTSRPGHALPVGYVSTQQSTWGVAGDAGTSPWKYFELPVPNADGTTTVENLTVSCRDCV